MKEKKTNNHKKIKNIIAHSPEECKESKTDKFKVKINIEPLNREEMTIQVTLKALHYF